MSIDIDIFATIEKKVLCKDLISALKNDTLFKETSKPLGGFIGLTKWHEYQQVVKPLNEEFGDPELECLEVCTGEPNRTSITFFNISREDTSWEEELAYFEEGSKDIPSDLRSSIAEKYKKFGYKIKIETLGGRHLKEPEFFVAFSAVVAEVFEGYVMVDEEVYFDLPIGLYTPNEFKKAKVPWPMES